MDHIYSICSLGLNKYLCGGGRGRVLGDHGIVMGRDLI